MGTKGRHDGGGIIATESKTTMKDRYAILIGLAAFGLTNFAFLLLISPRYSPDPQQRSAFLTSYNPRNAIAPFEYKYGTKLASGGESDSPGNRFVLRNVEFQEFFTAQKQSDTSVMAAVEQDTERQLTLHGARILLKKTDQRGAFRIDYAVGPVLGSIQLDPIIASPQFHPAWLSMPEGVEDKFLRIVIEEKWFPKSIPSQEELAQGDK